MMVKLTDSVLDASDGHTRLFLLAEHWKRKYEEVCGLQGASIAPTKESTACEIVSLSSGTSRTTPATAAPSDADKSGGRVL